jgi:4-hydroxy-3-polyprenylbenzoate decarboxylase
MKLVIAATGASGTIYLQRLLEQIDCSANEVHVVMSAHAKQVVKQEVDSFKLPRGIVHHTENDLNVHYVSGSARFDALVIYACSMAVNLMHARNVVTLLEAVAVVFPAIPSFYSRPKSIVDLVDTVVWRVLDQLGLPSSRTYRWPDKAVKAARKS